MNFSAHYRSALEGRTSALPPLPIQFWDFAACQTQRLERGDFDADLDYWRGRLAGPIPSLALPTDHERTPGLGYAGARIGSRMDAALLESLRALARAEGVTSYMVLLAVLSAVLHRYSGIRDVLIASPLRTAASGAGEPDRRVRQHAVLPGRPWIQGRASAACSSLSGRRVSRPCSIRTPPPIS